MNRQPRLPETLSHNKPVKLKANTPKFVFVADQTKDTATGVAWTAMIQSGDANVCRVSNDGDGSANHYQIIDPDLFDWLNAEAKKAYPQGRDLALDGYVADLWLLTMERIIYGRDPISEMGF
jgi:hypothetical protein